MAAARFALLVFTVEPQGGVQPEEGKGAHQQAGHHLECNPDLRVATEVVRIAVWLEAGKTRWHVRQALLGVVALLACLHPVVRVHFGLRVLGAHDLMAAVAIEALGGVAVAQGGDAAVEGVLVRIKLRLVAVSAVC